MKQLVFSANDHLDSITDIQSKIEKIEFVNNHVQKKNKTKSTWSHKSCHTVHCFGDIDFLSDLVQNWIECSSYKKYFHCECSLIFTESQFQDAKAKNCVCEKCKLQIKTIPEKILEFFKVHLTFLQKNYHQHKNNI